MLHTPSSIPPRTFRPHLVAGQLRIRIGAQLRWCAISWYLLLYVKPSLQINAYHQWPGYSTCCTCVEARPLHVANRSRRLPACCSSVTFVRHLSSNASERTADCTPLLAFQNGNTSSSSVSPGARIARSPLHIRQRGILSVK